MGLEINRDDPAGKERKAMADSSGKTVAGERLYETIDGKLVREGDTRGAFLKYGPGDPIADRHKDAFKELNDNDSGDAAANAYNDDEARAKLRLQHAGADAKTVHGGPTQMHDRLATELADEQRAVAALPAEERAKVMEDSVADKDAVFTPYAVWRKEDGSLVREGDAEGATQAYAAGDRVQNQDLDAYKKLDSTKDSDDKDGQGAEAKDGETPANKARVTPRTK